MNELQVFNYKDNKVRTVDVNGETWFVLKDVCAVLGIANHKMTAQSLEEDEVSQTYLTDSLGRQQKTTIISESGLYHVVLRSDKPEAKPFRKWVTSEVLPSVRKHGAYMTPVTIDQMIASPEFGIKLLTELKEEKERRQALETENQRQAQIIADFEPIRQYVDIILASPSALATSQVAADYDLSAKALNKILFEAGIRHNVNGQWILYKRYMGRGLTKSKTIPIVRSDGSHDARILTQWTQKGRLLIHEILTARGITAVMDRGEGQLCLE